MIADAYKVTPQDLQGALTAQKLTLQPGDAILMHTGWGTLWGKGQLALPTREPWHWHCRGRRLARRIRCW